MVRYTVHFTGRVQGVGFRYTTQSIAQEHAVAGYVQNLPDRRVRLVAEGADGAVNAFVTAVATRMRRCISDTSIDKSPATGEFGDPEPGALVVRY